MFLLEGIARSSRFQLTEGPRKPLASLTARIYFIFVFICLFMMCYVQYLFLKNSLMLLSINVKSGSPNSVLTANVLYKGSTVASWKFQYYGIFLTFLFYPIYLILFLF